MYFEKGQLYHIYNQGNNHRKVFFYRENYLFFLKKVKVCFEPFCDIIAWCLMPNHFHFMVLVNEVELSDSATGSSTSNRAPNGKPPAKLNKSIGILLASYTRAINNQQGTTGSLFRQKTKAECLTEVNGITPSFINTNTGTIIIDSQPEREYPQICFNYIHQNPVEAGLVKNAVEWEFSSARDYFGNRKDKIVKFEKAKEYIVL